MVDLKVDTDTKTELESANEKLLKLRRQYQYTLYLRSYTWKEKQYAVLRRAGYMCESCSNGMATEVHHLKYPKRWGDEPLDWLQAVCKPCHNNEHKEQEHVQ